MKAETITQNESIPDSYPIGPEDMSDAANLVDTHMLWQRIEAYTAYRFTPRTVVWTVDGTGHWGFPLAPATLTEAERWTGEAWEDVTLIPGPYGYCLPDAGPYRITATVGAGPTPPAVLEAYRRLAEYLAPGEPNNILFGRPGVNSHTGKVGDMEESYERNPAWIAKAMQNSGAGDLLRPYRRV